LATLSVAHNVAELYSSVLVDTPLAPYFQGCLSEEDLDEMNVELIRNTLYKAYLEDFHNYCINLAGTTAEIMCELLEFEADRRSINITLNSFGTDLGKDDREKLYPKFGLLHPEGLQQLAKADDAEQVQNIVQLYQTYRPLLESAGGQFGGEERSLEDAFFEYEVKLNRLSFEQQFHYGVFYSWLRLKEQEIRNIVWIAECIAQDQKPKINQYIPIF
jgi:V-type H+-transporting ATPase subunit d